MDKLGYSVFKFRKFVVILWIALFLAMGYFALKLPGVLSGNGFEYDGEYNQTKQLLENDFNQPKSSIIVLFEKQGNVSQDKWAQTISTAMEDAGKVEGVKQVLSPLDDSKMIKENIAYGVLALEKNAEESGSAVSELRSTLRDADGVKISITGEPAIVLDLNQASQEDLVRAEMIGLPIALIVLILAFGSLVAAGIPLLIGVFSIVTTMGIVYFFSHSFDLTIFILNIVPMIGLALSIDFALLLINRFKEEIIEHPVREAVAKTVATAGRSVVFSGLCVFIGLLGLLFIQVDIFQNVALGGVAVVLVSVLSAITLLPAVLGIVGDKINSFTIMKVDPDKPGIWSRSAHFVMKRPVIMALAAFALLVFSLIPVKDIELTVPGIDALPTSYDSREAFEKYEEQFIVPAEAIENKVTVVVESENDMADKDSLASAMEILNQLESDSRSVEVESIFSTTEIEDPNELAMVLAVENSPAAPAAAHYISGDKMQASIFLDDELSNSEKQAWVREFSEKDYGANVSFGGTPKFEQEIFDEISNKIPYGVVLILVSTFLILMAAFRSILIPLKAIFMNILSLGAAFGLIVWLFQGGHLSAEPVTIALILPVFVFSLVFGLSMDYEVFLISRIHEFYQKTGDNEYATLNGLISTSKIITSAAAIMIVITGAFAFTGVMPMKQLGIGIALAILIDASIIRMILVPSLMKLFGDWNWWFFGKRIKERSGNKS